MLAAMELARGGERSTAVMGIDDAVAISVEVEANVPASRTVMARRDEAASYHDDGEPGEPRRATKL